MSYSITCRRAGLLLVLHAEILYDRIPRIQGGADVTLTGEATRSSSTSQKPWSRPPISVDFNVLMFTASGLLVRFLKVFEPKNPAMQSVKWVRYLSKANGTYQIRVSLLEDPFPPQNLIDLRLSRYNNDTGFEQSFCCTKRTALHFSLDVSIASSVPEVLV